MISSNDGFARSSNARGGTGEVGSSMGFSFWAGHSRRFFRGCFGGNGGGGGDSDPEWVSGSGAESPSLSDRAWRRSSSAPRAGPRRPPNFRGDRTYSGVATK